MKRIRVDFEKRTRIIKAQHGMCNYPVSCEHAEGSLDTESAEKAKRIFKEIQVPVTRLKDQMTHGYGKAIEVPYIFRDFSKDENDPDNYFFFNTDRSVMSSVGPKRELSKEVNDPDNYFFFNTDKSVGSSVGPGRKIMIRLGAPREYWEPIYNKMPADFDKFATVCCNIIRHVNDGWAKGLKAGVKYWEIWNRADDPQCWSGGTWEDYYRLYETVARRIKALHPRLKIGGPAAADCSGDAGFLRGFLDYVKKHDVPIDFVSWNYYGTDPAEAFEQAVKVRRMVSETGFSKRVEIINDEWNCMTFDENGRFSVPYVRNMHGAAFDAAFMIQMHRARMDFSTYFDCQKNVPWGGLVHPGWIYAHKPLYAFLAFSRLYRIGMAADVHTSGRNIYALAASDGERRALMFSVYQAKKDRVEVSTGLTCMKKIYLLDEDHDLEEIMTTSDESFTLPTKGYTVVYVETV